ncbi:MAG TPA: hypothetical protein VH520_10535 [Streptosporangiaceae bacterium]
MRYRLMANYDGSPFEAGIGPTGDDIVLFAACPPPEELGFEPATGHWRKQVRFADVQAVWESRPVGQFRGERCLVLDDLGDRLHIGYLGHDGLVAERLGYWQVDRGVFELIAPRSEVTEILEERLEVPSPAVRARDAEHPSGPIPLADFGAPAAPPLAASKPAARVPVPVPDDRTGVALPTPLATPLPLEAEAMRAASAAAPPRREGMATVASAPQAPEPALARQQPRQQPRQHRAAGRRKDTERLFTDLASLAGIPADSYSVGEEADGAMCLLETELGFEVFLAAGGDRHELQSFATEEAACFYLFGVLVAEQVRTGALARALDAHEGWHSQPA